MNKLELARQIAATADVSTPESSVVLYSISYQPTDSNKRAALKYIAENRNSFTLDNTICGRQLMALNLETGNNNPDAELLKIWAVASRRFILAASGNITAFVENADRRSTFVTVELPLILQNDKIKLINGIDKFEFAHQFLQ
ncbi:MAG: hypothetical protein IJ218_00945 [Alphaproteobacteria bacterium]|nr:hypothetical protein [Alphaproteobacteria bacterium]